MPERFILYSAGRLRTSALTVFLLLFVLTCPSYAGLSRGERKIYVNPATPLHKLSKKEISNIREKGVQEYKDLGIFPLGYRPEGSIFGEIDEGADWVNDVQFFVNNPYLLVLTAAHNRVDALLPYCGVEYAGYSYKKIQVDYTGASAKRWFYYIYDYYPDSKGIVRLWFVNANDSGFRYAHVDMARSANIAPDWPEAGGSIVKGAYTSREFFHVGHLKKNNISSLDTKKMLKLIEKDKETVIYIKLWREHPRDINAEEDLAYVIRITP